MPVPDPPTDRISDAEALTEDISVRQSEPKNTTEVAQPHADLWRQLSSEFSWNYPDAPAIRRAVGMIKQHPREFERATERATPYLWHVADELRRRKLPAELAVLPLIESGWRAHAQSPRGAAGLWQFMPVTGRKFGLKQTRWYDARRDVVASTRAALDYFDQLIQRFDGDWLLALAAYNCGPTKVRRALKKNPASDFWAIAPNLPPETRRYIPRLLAAIHVVSDPIGNEVALHPIPNKPVFARLDLKSPISLEHLYGIDGWTQTEFAELNPGFNRGHTDPFGPYEILVPISLAQQIADALALIPADQRVPSTIHTVESGDTLSQIASRYDIELFELKTHNQLRGNLIKVGKELIVPMPGQSHSAIATPGGRTDVTEHIVRRGDSLWAIAQKFKVSIEQLQMWNNFSRHRVLQPGESLTVSNPNGARQRELKI